MMLEFVGCLFDAGLLRWLRLLKDVLGFRFLIVGFGVFKLLDESCSSVWVIQLTFGEELLIERDFVVGIALRRFFRLGDHASKIVVAKQ